MLEVHRDLRVEVYHSTAVLPELAKNALRQAEILDTEQGRDWLDNLVGTVFPNDSSVGIYALFLGQQLQALLPVRVDQDCWGKTILPLGNFYTSLYQPFFSADLTAESLAHLLRELMLASGPASSFRFSPMDIDGRCYRLFFAAFQRAGLPAFPFFCFGNWYHSVTETWADYLVARSGQVKSTIKRKTKEFQKAGGVLELISGGELLESGIEAYNCVYSSSWKVPEPFPEFTPGLIRMLAKNGWLRLGVASLNGRPIAAQIWIVAYGKASIFKLAYHEEFKRFSAGTLLTALLMERVIDVDAVQEIDYLIGDDPYKAAWMSERRERWGIVAYNPQTVFGLLGWGGEVLGRLVKPVVARFRKTRVDANAP